MVVQDGGWWGFVSAFDLSSYKNRQQPEEVSDCRTSSLALTNM